jgi:SpoVK/Ycf46/Vps4 family AAA+-type ATPase
VQVLVRLLQKAGRKAVGVNVLLYGPPGTGKTELAKVVAQAAGLELFEVEYADRDGNSLSGRDRYRSCRSRRSSSRARSRRRCCSTRWKTCFRPSARRGRPDGALDEQQALAAAVQWQVNGKAWVNQILESNPVPTIWVTNRIEQIDPAFRRRFAYHLELKSPPPGAREQLVRKTLDGVAVSEAFVAKLTERKGLTPAQIRTAVRFAGLAHAAVAERPGLRGADRAAAEERRRGAGASPTGRRTGPPAGHHLRPGMLNVESRFEMPRIVEALKARGHGTLCFYGAPGTGKTALGEHIARALEQPLIVKQASDLMSKYVGETEQNMAACSRGQPKGGAAAGRGRQLPAGPPVARSAPTR